VEQALARATAHARNAVAESLLSARSLLDAVSLALTGRAVDALDGDSSGLAGALAGFAAAIERLAGRARGADDTLPPSLADALVGALDVEIARWEQRSAGDPDARAVLRAFLGLREILWELGVRRSDDSADGADVEDMDDGGQATRRNRPPPSPRSRSGRSGKGKRPRVQRTQVEG
jgi:hypothetical protein